MRYGRPNFIDASLSSLKCVETFQAYMVIVGLNTTQGGCIVPSK